MYVFISTSEAGDVLSHTTQQHTGIVILCQLLKRKTKPKYLKLSIYIDWGGAAKFCWCIL